MGSRSEAGVLSYQLRCPGCGAPVETTFEGARRGIEACAYCGDLVALPDEVAATAPEPAPRPATTAIAIEREDTRLRIEIPARGWKSAAPQAKVFAIVLGVEIAALAFAWLVHPAFWASALFALPAVYFIGRELTASFSRRVIELGAERISFAVYGPYAWLSGKVRDVREAPLDSLRRIGVRVLDASTEGRTQALLMHAGDGDVRVLAIAPQQETEEELRWLLHELQAFVAAALGDGDAAAAREGILEVGLTLSCLRCDAPLAPSAADMLRAHVECPHCQSQSVLAPRLRALAGVGSHRHQASYRRSPIELRLGPDRLEVVLPPRGWTPMTIGQGVGFGCWAGTALSAAVGFALIDTTKSMLVAGALGVLVLPALVRTIAQVYGTARLSIDRETTTCERRFLGLVRTTSAPTAAIEARYVVPGGEGSERAIVHQLRLDTGGGRGIVLGHGQLGDEWVWLASEINAFKSSVRASV